MTNAGDSEAAGWVLAPTTWGERVRAWIRRWLPRPAIAIGHDDLYAVVVHGTGFWFAVDDGPPVDGFFTTRVVAAPDTREAERRALAMVDRDWRRRGHGSLVLELETIRVLDERFRLRRGGGATFYRSAADDPDA